MRFDVSNMTIEEIKRLMGARALLDNVGFKRLGRKVILIAVG